MPDAAAAIDCSGVAVRYPHEPRDAVGPVSIRLRAGERRLLLGPSGSGKSTFLHSLTGLIPASIPAERRGDIRLFGAAGDSRGPADWADRVAILAEEPATWELLGGAMDELGTRLPEALFEPDGDLRPHVRGQLETLQERLLAAFPIADIVEGQVLAMDPEAIERLVDDVGRRELGWIQVLGLILGALAGIVLAVGL